MCDVFVCDMCLCDVSQCKKLDIRYRIFLRIFENNQNIRLSTIFEI